METYKKASLRYIYLGTPSKKIVEWIKNHKQPDVDPDVDPEEPTTPVRLSFTLDIDTSLGSGNEFSFTGIQNSNDENDFYIDWGDGNISVYNDNTVKDFQHTYEAGGNYKVEVDKKLIQFGKGQENTNAKNIIKNIIFEEDSTLTSIGDYGFNGCSNLEAIIIPESLVTLGNRAFENCSGLSEINLPITLSGELGERVFQGCSAIEKVTASCPVIARAMFDQITNLNEIILEPSVTQIKRWAFYSSSNLTKVIIPNSVQYIGLETFFNIPPTCTISTDHTYYDLMNIPESSSDSSKHYPWTNQTDIKFICSNGTVSFNGTDNILHKNDIEHRILTVNTDFGIDENDDYICISGFVNDKLTGNVAIPEIIDGKPINFDQDSNWDTVHHSFENVDNLDIPNGPTIIGSYMFNNIKKIQTLNLPTTITDIRHHAFLQPNALTSLYLHEGITHIGEGAFAHCTSLQELYFPSTLSSIESNAFENTPTTCQITVNMTRDEFKSFGTYPYGMLDGTTLSCTDYIIHVGGTDEAI